MAKGKPLQPQLRVLTAAQLYAAGRSPAQVRTLVRSGRLVVIGHGIYVTQTVASQFAGLEHGDHWLRAAAVLVAAGPGSVLSHQSAALAHNIDVIGQVDHVTMTTTQPGRRGRRNGVHRYQVVSRPEIVRKFGLPVTTPLRTVIDLIRTLPFPEGVVAADCAARLGEITLAELRLEAERLPQRPGSVRLARAAYFADSQAESPLESLARAVFDDGGLPPPVLQMPIHGDRGFIGRVDFYWPQHKTIAEVDGAAKYADPDRARKQLWRDKALRETGHEVVHFNWTEVTTQPERVVMSIRAAFARAARNSAA